MTEISTLHEPRISLSAELPDFYAAMVRVNRAAAAGLGDDRLAALVELRASQINGCAFCLDMHARKLRELGESQQRMDVLAAWREAPFFDEREQAALELCESVTRLGEGGVPDEVWERAAAAFEPGRLAGLLAMIVTINAWNRVAVPSRSVPGSAV